MNYSSASMRAAHDAKHYQKIVEQKEKLELLLLKTKEIIETSSAVEDTLWYDDITSLCDMIEITLEEDKQDYIDAIEADLS